MELNKNKMNKNNQAFKEFPKDPFMLMSVINSKLRDFYPDLDSLCKENDLDKNTLLKDLNNAGFEYNKEYNKFW